MKSLKEFIEMMEKFPADPELKKEERSIKDIITILKSLESRLSNVEESNSRCKCCKDPIRDDDEAFQRIHGMLHKLLPHLNEDEPIIGQQAMLMLIVHKHLDAGNAKGHLLEMVSDHWDSAIEARDQNEGEDND